MSRLTARIGKLAERRRGVVCFLLAAASGIRLTSDRFTNRTAYTLQATCETLVDASCCGV